MATTSPLSTVRRRHVLFVAGFDRKRPRYYHALYRSQARRQAAVSGSDIQVSRERTRPSATSTAWTISSGSADGRRVHTVYELLEWHDIVHAHWARSVWRVLSAGAATIVFGLRDGAAQRMFRLFAPPVYATVLPLLLLALCAVVAIPCGLALAWAAVALTGAPMWLAASIGASTAALLFGAGVLLVHRLQFTWLLRLVRFTHRQAVGAVPELEQRLDSFAQRVAALRSPADGNDAPDEILIVGHSVGATLAVSLLARVLDLPAERPDGRQVPLVLLSLGHCMPLLGTFSQADSFRRDLQRVAHSPINWLDISAPIDWAAFPQVDPLAAAGLPAAPRGWHPRLISPRFHQLFSDAAYACLKRNRFKVHLQYLMASEYAGRYDYFAITAGAQTLRERFAEADDDTDPSPLASSVPTADPASAGR